MKKHLVYFLWKNIALVSFIINTPSNKAGITETVILSLILPCLHLFVCLANVKKARKSIHISLLALEVVVLCFYEITTIGLGLIVLLELMNLLLKENYIYIFSLSFVLIVVLFYQDGYLLAEQISLVGGVAITIYLNDKLHFYKEMSISDKATIIRQRNDIEAIKRHEKTIKEVAILEERNRFSGRIHDKIGHSISGSIILLEATMLVFESNPEKAKNNIKRAVENLQNGVDDIRKSLREERPKLPILNLAEIKSTLEKFSLEYGVLTQINSESDLERIQVEIWRCIHENLKEALTNLLKHSKASYFTLKITVVNKIIRVEYINDGVNTDKETITKKGIGLMSIDERTSFLGGTSIAVLENELFILTNVFISNN